MQHEWVDGQMHGRDGWVIVLRTDIGIQQQGQQHAVACAS